MISFFFIFFHLFFFPSVISPFILKFFSFFPLFSYFFPLFLPSSFLQGTSETNVGQVRVKVTFRWVLNACFLIHFVGSFLKRDRKLTDLTWNRGIKYSMRYCFICTHKRLDVSAVRVASFSFEGVSVAVPAKAFVISLAYLTITITINRMWKWPWLILKLEGEEKC